MTLTAADHRDAGALIAKALDPKLRTATDPDYRRLLDRYRTVAELRDLVQLVLTGMDLVVLAADDLGLVVAPTRESVLAAHLSDVPNTGTVTHRMLFGVALVGIAAYAFPRREDLESERPRYVTIADVDEFLRRECTGLAQARGEADAETDEFTAYQVYARLAPRRSAERIGPKSSYYWVLQALEWLSDHGMARLDKRSADGAWVLTERFRLHVADLAGNAAYVALSDLAAAAGTYGDSVHRQATGFDLPRTDDGEVAS